MPGAVPLCITDYIAKNINQLFNNFLKNYYYNDNNGNIIIWWSLMKMNYGLWQRNIAKKLKI